MQPCSARPVPFWVTPWSLLALLWLGVGLPALAADTNPAPVLGAVPAGARGSPPLPAAVDLRPSFKHWGLGPRQQGSRGTCSVFTLTGALEFAAAAERQHGERFSVEFLNWAANRVAGQDQDGGFFADLWSAFDQYGICLEETFPYRAQFEPTLGPAPEALVEAKTRLALHLRHHWIKEWDVKTGLTEGQFQAIKQTLQQGWPVCGGFRWPKHPQWTNEVLQMCPAEAVFDGHSVLIVGYHDDANRPGGGVLLFFNSNSAGRDGSMPYAYARNYMNDAIWIEAARPAQAAAPAPGLSVPTDRGL